MLQSRQQPPHCPILIKSVNVLPIQVGEVKSRLYLHSFALICTYWQFTDLSLTKCANLSLNEWMISNFHSNIYIGVWMYVRIYLVSGLNPLRGPRKCFDWDNWANVNWWLPHTDVNTLIQIEMCVRMRHPLFAKFCGYCGFLASQPCQGAAAI